MYFPVKLWLDLRVKSKNSLEIVKLIVYANRALRVPGTNQGQNRVTLTCIFNGNQNQLREKITGLDVKIEEICM